MWDAVYACAMGFGFRMNSMFPIHLSFRSHGLVTVFFAVTFSEISISVGPMAIYHPVGSISGTGSGRPFYQAWSCRVRHAE